jgi:hypothetical protein
MSRFATFVVSSFAFLLVAICARADEPGTVGVEEPAVESAPADDPVTALLQSEVLRYYQGIGTEPSEAELQSGLDAAFDLILAEISIGQIGAAIDEAISRHEPGGRVLFQVAVPRFVRATAEEEAAPPPQPAVVVEQDEPSINADLATRGSWTRTRAITDRSLALLDRYGTAASPEVLHLRATRVIVFGGVSLFFGVPPLVGGTVTLVVIGADGGFLDDPIAQFFGAFAFISAIGGGVLTVVGAILLHLGVENLRSARAEQRRRENPDLRFTSARRAQVEWGIRFGVL